MSIGGIPDGPVVVPARVRALAGEDVVEPVWRNELGGLTFRAGADTARDRYIKWVPVGTPEIDLAAEAVRSAWAARWANVPRVLEQGADAAGSWLVTAALPGRSAVDPRWIGRPEIAVPAIGRGLRILHEALPVGGCPFVWSVRARTARFEERLRGGEGPADWSTEHEGLTIGEARARLADAPGIDELVVCHGDACVPNTLLDDDGRYAAHVDLGSLGLADRWADLAVAAWSTEWNYGPGYEGLVYAGYGIDPDPERIAYYRLLWDLA